jgi:hypothetical protein
MDFGQTILTYPNDLIFKINNRARRNAPSGTRRLKSNYYTKEGQAVNTIKNGLPVVREAVLI